MLKVLPLGGLGEVGLNNMLFEHGGERMLVDCGVLFPRAEMPGIDVIVPDFGLIAHEAHSLKGVVLTHAHEDHIGALPWLLRAARVPIYGTRFTLAVVASKLAELGIDAELHEVVPGNPFKVGREFQVEMIHVTHSTPHAVGLYVRTSSATLVHTGDFKLDATPMLGAPTDEARFQELGKSGIDVLLSDSTNAEVPGETASEASVAAVLEDIIKHAPGRVFVAMFGSQMERVSHLAQAALRTNRRLVILGRSLDRNVRLAERCGLFSIPPTLRAEPEEAATFPRDRVVVVCTGAQGEVVAALSHLVAPDSTRPLRVEKGDTVVLSSRAIPGNEPIVSDLIGKILSKGARALYPRIAPGVHTSGHAAQEEQKRLIDWVKPKVFMPVHGERRQLQAHLDLAQSVGVPTEGLTLALDGDLVGIAHGRATREGHIPVGRQYALRDSDGHVPLHSITQRQEIAAGGVLTVAVALNADGLLAQSAAVAGLGLSNQEEAFLSLVADAIRVDLEGLPRPARGDDARVKDAIVQCVRRKFRQLSGKRPSLIVSLLRV